MKTVISKYPIMIGGILVPQGTVGTIADIEDIRKDFPNICYKQDSNQIAVKFLELKPCIVHTSQVVFNQD